MIQIEKKGNHLWNENNRLLYIYELYEIFFITVGTFAVACLMMGSAIEKGLKSPNVNIITTCVNVTSSVTPVSNLTNETVQQFSLSCSDNTESVKLQIAMAVTFMVGLIQVCITLSIKRYRPYEITYIFFQSFKACYMQWIFNFFFHGKLQIFFYI